MVQFMERNTLIIGIVIIIVLIGAVGAFFYFNQPTQEKVLVMGTSADYPPFEYVAENNTIVGFDVDIAKYIANKYGYKLEIKDIPFDSLIPALQAGEIDFIVAAMTITAEREQQVDFSIPYYNATQAVLIKSDHADIASITDLYGLKVGVQAGTTGEAWVDDNLGNNVTKIAYQRAYDAITALKAGQIDALILDDPVANYYASIDNEIKLASLHIDTGERYGIAVRNGDTQLLNMINEALREMFENGYYDQLIARYFGTSSTLLLI